MNYFKNKNRILDKLLNQTEREILVNGVGNILISCPHSVVHFRNGTKKLDEPDTLIIANYLNKVFNLPYLYKVKSDNEDANFDLNSNYKRILIDYITSNNIKLLIDLHELDPNRREIINIGLNNFNNINSSLFINEFIISFSSNNIGLISIDKPFSASSTKTISNYVHSTTGIDCIQIELNTKLFKTSEKYKIVLKSFREAINSINSLEV